MHCHPNDNYLIFIYFIPSFIPTYSSLSFICSALLCVVSIVLILATKHSCMSCHLPFHIFLIHFAFSCDMSSECLCALWLLGEKCHVSDIHSFFLCVPEKTGGEQCGCVCVCLCHFCIWSEWHYSYVHFSFTFAFLSITAAWISLFDIILWHFHGFWLRFIYS